MTSTQVKRMLEGVKLIDTKISEQTCIVKSLRTNMLTSDLSAIAYDKDRVQATPADPANKMIRAIDVIQRHESIIADLLQKKKDLIDLVSRLDNGVERLILFDHYFCHEDMGSIADKMCYARATVYRYRDAGIDHLAEILAKDETQ